VATTKTEKGYAREHIIKEHNLSLEKGLGLRALRRTHAGDHENFQHCLGHEHKEDMRAEIRSDSATDESSGNGGTVPEAIADGQIGLPLGNAGANQTQVQPA
jgi:hypothetical protein